MSTNSASTPVRRGRGRPRDAELRRRILTTAARLASEEGIDVSFERIAQEVGASRTTLYRWWRGSRELLLDALLETAAFTLDTDDEAPIPEQLRAQVRSAAAVLLDEVTGAPLRALAATALTRESSRIDFVEHWLKPRRDRARPLIARGIADGTIVDDDPDLLIDVLFSPVYHRALFSRKPLDDAFVDGLLRRVTT